MSTNVQNPEKIPVKIRVSVRHSWSCVILNDYLNYLFSTLGRRFRLFFHFFLPNNLCGTAVITVHIISAVRNRIKIVVSLRVQQADNSEMAYEPNIEPEKRIWIVFCNASRCLPIWNIIKNLTIALNKYLTGNRQMFAHCMSFCIQILSVNFH